MGRSSARRVDPKWIRNASDTLAVKQGCWFDESAGRFPIEFIEEFCRQSKGRWAGTKLELLDWQKDFLMRLFGWRLPNGLRRFRQAYLEVAKKNGKSTMISALALFLLLASGEGSPEIHLNAVDRDQASIVFDEAKNMVAANPDLESRLTVIASRKRITHEASNGRIQANSAEVPNKDGLNPSTTIFDELHRQKTSAMWDIYEYAGAAREEPLRISITTAGDEESGVWFEQRKKSEQVNAGVDPDITHLGVVYRALPTDDIDDPAVWAKANPSLGHTIKLEDFARELADAKLEPRKLANFMRLRLNIVVRTEQAFVDIARWDLCKGPAIVVVDAERFPSWMGLDLSETNDLTALALLSEDSGESVLRVTMRFWLPEENIVELERVHQVPYRAWAKLGLIVLTPGNVLDYDWVRKDVNALAGEHELRKILIDPYNATKLAIELKEQDGLPVETIRQGFLSLSAPTKELLRLVLGQQLRHDGNPILRWHAANAIADQDAAGNLKLSKRKSRKKIDGMSALVNAVAGRLEDGDGGGDSVYEKRGVIWL